MYVWKNNKISLAERPWCIQKTWGEKNQNINLRCKVNPKSSGNQAGYVLLKVAEMQQEKNPEVCIIIRCDTFVDDCLTCEEDHPIVYVDCPEWRSILVQRNSFLWRWSTNLAQWWWQNNICCSHEMTRKGRYAVPKHWWAYSQLQLS